MLLEPAQQKVDRAELLLAVTEPVRSGRNVLVLRSHPRQVGKQKLSGKLRRCSDEIRYSRGLLAFSVFQRLVDFVASSVHFSAVVLVSLQVFRVFRHRLNVPRYYFVYVFKFLNYNKKISLVLRSSNYAEEIL